MSDSSTGQIVGGVVGAVVGYFAGNPALGFSIGYGLGGVVDPPPGPEFEGPRLDDLSVTTGNYGAPLVTVDGTDAVHGNMIWVENNQIKEVVKKEDSGGKGGGGGSETTTYEYFITCAISLADVQCDSIGRIWLGGELIANPQSDDLATAVQTGRVFPLSSVYSRLQQAGGDAAVISALAQTQGGGSFKFYPGLDAQLPDPRMEADLGVGNCPAYRGMAYLVLYDWPLEKLGNSPAGVQVKAELINSDGDSGLTLLRSDHITRLNKTTDQSAAANYVWPGDTIVEYPRWSGSFNETSTHLIRANFGVSDPRVGEVAGFFHSAGVSEDANGVGYMQMGITDDRDFYTTGAFQGTLSRIGNYVGFADAGGRFVSKGGQYAGVIFAPVGAKGIWRWTGRSIAGATHNASVATTKAVTMDDSYDVYALELSPVKVKKYDATLAEIASREFTYAGGGLGGLGQAFIHWDSGLVYLIEGKDARYVHVMPDDLSSDPVYLGDIGAAPHSSTSASRDRSSVTVKGGILTRFNEYNDYSCSVERWKLPTPSIAGRSLAAVVRERMERSELIEPGDIDVTQLTDTVRGYSTKGIASIRSGIEPLMLAYQFDLVPSGYKIKAVPRGQAPVKTIDYDDLDARSFGSAPGVALASGFVEDHLLPYKTVVRHTDADREYDTSEQYSPERRSSATVAIKQFEIPLVLTPDEAAGIAETLQYLPWLERQPQKFTLPHSYRDLEPGDVVTLPAPEATYELRTTDINYLTDGRVECEALPNSATVYQPNAVGGTGIVPAGTISYPSPAVMLLLDIPMIRDEDDKPGFGMALCGTSAGWPGGVVAKTVDSGQTWSAVQGFSQPVTAGVARDALADHDCYVIDRQSQLVVDLYTSDMSLSAITEEQMLTGKHWCAYGAPGRWEIIRFANATLNADDSYTLSTLIRGCRGSEWAAALHQDYDTFVFLSDADMAFVGADIGALGVSRAYRGVTVGRDIDDVADTDFAYTGENLKPLSPVYLGGSIDGSNNWDLTWTERSRYTTSWWTTGVERPNEPTESYEIDIVDGANVVRTLASNTNAVEYTSADQVTDFGSNQTALTFRVYQISATVGRGRVAEATL